MTAARRIDTVSPTHRCYLDGPGSADRIVTAPLSYSIARRMKEAVRRSIAPVILFVADTDRVSARSYPTLERQIPPTALVTVDNEYVVRGELPPAFARGKILHIAALPNFLRTYVDRLSFSFSDYLRQEKDSSTELHQWIRRNYLSFRELELSLILQGS